ncbi:MAG: hypothetical protein LBP86_04015 [Azoarcus sp.]|jgi:hypothetical protein|nr:hypothetical protein [Azoarcus sp.]
MSARHIGLTVFWLWACLAAAAAQADDNTLAAAAGFSPDKTAAAAPEDETRPPKRLEQNWRAGILVNRYGYQKSSPLNPNRYSTPLRRTERAAILSSRTQIRLHQQISATVNGVASSGRGNVFTDKDPKAPKYAWGNVFDGENARVLEAYVSFSDADKMQHLILGKQKIRWSQDSTFHPFDIFGRYNQDKNTIGLNEYDPYQQEGPLLVRQQGSYRALSWDLVYADARKNLFRRGNRQAALKVDARWKSTEISALVEKTSGYKVRSGGAISQGIGDNWGFYAEFLHAGERTLPVPELVSPPVQTAPDFSLPAVYRLGLPDADNARPANQILFTLRRSINGIGNIETSYFHNQNGYTRREWDRLAALAASAESTYIDPAYLAFYPGKDANPHGEFLGALATLSKHQYLRRKYVGLRLDTLENWRFARLESNFIYNAEDRSSTSSITLRKTIFDNAMLNIFGAYSAGPGDSEAQLSPMRTSIGTYFQWDF